MPASNWGMKKALWVLWVKYLGFYSCCQRLHLNSINHRENFWERWRPDFCKHSAIEPPLIFKGIVTLQGIFPEEREWHLIEFYKIPFIRLPWFLPGLETQGYLVRMPLRFPCVASNAITPPEISLITCFSLKANKSQAPGDVLAPYIY